MLRRRGHCSAAAGLYLIAWVSSSARRTSRGVDLVQRQHTAIGRCLLAAGLQELLFARARQGERLARTHDAWFANLAVVALVFVGHPQRASRAVVALRRYRLLSIDRCLPAGVGEEGGLPPGDFRRRLRGRAGRARGGRAGGLPGTRGTW